MKNIFKALWAKISGFIRKQWKANKKRFIITTIILSLIVIVLILSVSVKILINKNKQDNEPQLIVETESSLDVVVEIGDLITVEYPYSAIVSSFEEDNKKEVKYYIAYDGVVYASFDGKKLQQEINNDDKKLIITLPEIELRPVINEKTIQYIFENEKYHTETISDEILKLCKNDLLDRAKKDTDILEIARQNAISVIEEQTEPLVKANNPEYSVEVK